MRVTLAAIFVVFGAAFAMCAGCTPRVHIEPSPHLAPPDCTAPDVVDGDDVTPIAVGDSVEGSADDGVKYAFCAKAGTWVRFDFEQRKTVQQPVLRVKQGSVVIAENRFYGFESDKASQLYVTGDADAHVVYELELEPLNAAVPSAYGLSLSRPTSEIVIAPENDSVPFDGEVWGALTDDDDVDAVALPTTDHAGVLEVRAAIAGFFGNGATLSPVVDVVDGQGAVLAREDFSDKLELELPVDAGASLSLHIHGSGSNGERPFYALENVSLTTTAPATEQNDADNGTIAGAEFLTLEPVDLGTRAATVVATLSEGDVDTFAFSAPLGATVHFVCKAEAVGSGAFGITVDLRDKNGTLLPSGRSHEDPVDHVVVGGTRTFVDGADSFASEVAGGTFYGQVSASAFSDDVVRRYAICTASTQ